MSEVDLIAILNTLLSRPESLNRMCTKLGEALMGCFEENTDSPAAARFIALTVLAVVALEANLASNGLYGESYTQLLQFLKSHNDRVFSAPDTTGVTEAEEASNE